MIRLIAWFAGLLATPFGKRNRVRLDTLYFLYGFPVRRRVQHYGVRLRCSGPVHVTRKTYLGDHVGLNGAYFYGGGKVTIGNYFHSGDGLRIYTRNHNYHGEAIPYDATFVTKDVEIGDFVWIGAQVILLPGTKIGEGAIIQAGSVVHGEIPPYSIAGGNPAKVFAQRDIEHFKRLKAEGKFY